MQVKMRDCNVRKGREIALCNGHSKLAHYELLKAVFSLQGTLHSHKHDSSIFILSMCIFRKTYRSPLTEGLSSTVYTLFSIIIDV